MRILAETAERSIVTVLAVDTVNSTGHIAGDDPDDAQELLDRIYEHLDGTIRRAGGLMVNYSGDGGIAVFGWPTSMEDHADRACETAWLIQHPATEAGRIRDMLNRPIRFRVGIHSGLVGLRRMDMQIGSRLDPVGGTVHIAAALQKIAPPDSVFVSSKTVELCRSALDLAPLDDVKILKQIAASAYSLSGPPRARGIGDSDSRNYRTPLVGRQREHDSVRHALGRQDPGCRAIAVIGEPGIGKSRLAAAIIQDAQQSSRLVLIFRGDSQRRTTPYSAVRSLILAASSLSETATDDDIVAGLTAAGIEHVKDGPLATVLLAKAGGERSGQLTQTQVARTLVEALTTLTAGMSTLVVVEDLHLLDLESIYCLRLMGENTACEPCTLLVTGRPESLAEARDIATTVLRLDPLPRAEMRELAQRLWPPDAPQPAILETVLDRADGVPFVLEQIVLSIQDASSEGVKLVPQSVQSVIHARLNRLPPGAKECAQALSVLGNEVEIDVALQVLNKDSETLMRECAELERLEIVQPSIGTSIRFRHAIVAEACSETVPGPRRRELHRAAIAAITATYSDLGAQFERLAFHAESARNDEQALEYLWLAGLRARRSSSGGSLFLIFQRAMQCVERIGEPAERRFVDFVLMAFAQLLQIGEFTKMIPYLPRALELAQSQDRPERVCAALCHMGLVSWFKGRYVDCREQSERALAIATELDNLPLKFSAKFMLATALYGMGEIKQAIDMQLELRDTFGGPLEAARLGAAAIPSSIVRSFLGWFMMEVGQYEQGLSHAEEALEIATREGEPYSELLARLGLGRNLLKLRRDRDAADCLQVAINLVDQYGYDPALPHAVGLLASALARTGEPAKAVWAVEAWLARGLQDRTGRLELYYLNAGYAEALAQLGSSSDALAAINRALDVARNINNPCLIVQGLGVRAGLLAAFEPDSTQISADIAEQTSLCRRYGLVADEQLRFSSASPAEH
ncbi:MAG: AAA family ATPase [Rhodospirillales bacterium]|nr:AAA family ATPase [Rhodospirillales bacterium]